MSIKILKKIIKLKTKLKDPSTDLPDVDCVVLEAEVSAVPDVLLVFSENIHTL